MRTNTLFIILLTVIIAGCDSPGEKFREGEYSGDYPITDFITEVPVLDEIPALSALVLMEE